MEPGAGTRFRCGGDGLFLSANGDLVGVSGNIVGRSGRDGIHIARSEPAHLHHNTIFSNARHGIFVELAYSLLSIDHNLVSGNAGAGLATGFTEYPPDLCCNDPACTWFACDPTRAGSSVESRSFVEPSPE